MTGQDHEALQTELRNTANGMMVSYWESFRSQGNAINSPAELAPALQVSFSTLALCCCALCPGQSCLEHCAFCAVVILVH